MKSNLWIAVLTLTAVVLSAIMLASGDRTAHAGMLNAQPNVTMMTAGNANDEGLVIVDKTQQKIIVYLLKNNELTPIVVSRLGQQAGAQALSTDNEQPAA